MNTFSALIEVRDNMNASFRRETWRECVFLRQVPAEVMLVPVGSGQKGGGTGMSTAPIDSIALTKYRCEVLREKAAGPTEGLDISARDAENIVIDLGKKRAYAVDPEVDRFVSMVEFSQADETIIVPVNIIKEISVEKERWTLRCRATLDRGDTIEGDLRIDNLVVISGIDPTGSRREEQLQSKLVGNVKIIKWD